MCICLVPERNVTQPRLEASLPLLYFVFWMPLLNPNLTQMSVVMKKLKPYSVINHNFNFK